MLKRQPFLDRFLTANTLLWATGIVLVICGLVFYCTSLHIREKVLLAGFLLAVSGWLFTSAITTRNRIKQHTIELITGNRFDGTFSSSSACIRKYLANHDFLTEEHALKIFNVKEGDDERVLEVRNAIVDVLNFYEVLALMIWFKDTNELILKEYYYDLVLGHYEKLNKMIPLWRREEKEAFKYFEWLYNRWKIKLAP